MRDHPAHAASDGNGPDDRDGQAQAARSVLAAAGAVVAYAQAEVAHERSCEADAMVTSFGSDPSGRGDATPDVGAEQAREHARALGAEHNRLAKRSVRAATLAVESLAENLPDEEFARSPQIAEGIAAVVAAKNIVRNSDAALRAGAAADAEQPARPGGLPDGA